MGRRITFFQRLKLEIYPELRQLQVEHFGSLNCIVGVLICLSLAVPIVTVYEKLMIINGIAFCKRKHC